MDSLSRVGEPLPDIAAAERVNDARRQAGERPKGASRRRSKKGGPEPETTAGDGRESRAEEESGGASVDQERSEACYGRDKTVAPIRPKGRLIDIAI